MATPHYVTYEESTPWPPWAALLVWAAFGVPAAIAALEAASLLREGAPGPALAKAIAAVALAMGPFAVRLFLGRLHVRVTRSSLLLGFGYVPLIQKLVTFDEITAMEPLTYSPLAEFGGWGIRRGGRGKKAWTIRGDRALRLSLGDGTSLYVGSEDPVRLGNRVRLAGGRRWDRWNAAAAGAAGEGERGTPGAAG